MFNIDTAIDFKIDNESPLARYQRLSKLDIITLENFLDIHNPDMTNFSLNELVTKLTKNCTQYSKKHPEGDTQVSSGYIKEKISKHFTHSTGKFNHNKNKDFNSIYSNKQTGIVIPENLRKYTIYLAYDSRDIHTYASPESVKLAEKMRKKKLPNLQKRYKTLGDIPMKIHLIVFTGY